MSDVLSQAEIDSLLDSLKTGTVDLEEMKKSSENVVKDYDFARPSKFSKEHLRTLEIIIEHYGRLLSTNLPIYLRENITVEVVNSEAVTYMEFTNALSNPVILGIVDFAPLQGGQGLPLEKTRDFTEIELLIIERVMTSCVELLREPWENVVEISPRLDRIETNSQFAQIISPSEMIAIVTLNIKLGPNAEGMMNICLPYLTLEPVMDKLNTKFWYSNMQEKTGEDYTEDIEDLLKRADVPITAVLGNSTINVSDFASLQVGDIIRLDKKVNDELDIYVGDIKKFEALPGTVGKDYAVRLTSILREEEDG